jgi:sulfatase modifying factor 1
MGCAAVVSLVASAAAAQTVSATLYGYDLVKVGDPGNAAAISANANRNGYGAVDYEFWIGKYEVTIGQYAEFLNAVAKFEVRGLWNASMDTDQATRGITRNGSNGSYEYTVVGPNGINPAGAESPENRPITYVSWFDAARFANWMSNGKPTVTGTTAEALALIDNGAYDLGTATTGPGPAKNTINPYTGAAPTFYIPTENEWFKAAYFSPVKVSGTAPGYWAYPTQSDTAPGNGWDGTDPMASKDLFNQANYRAANRYAVTGGTTALTSTSDQNWFTDVGTFSLSSSYYGAFDMGGNAWEYTDFLGVSGTERSMRGGSANNGTSDMTTGRASRLTTSRVGTLGFRLASPVPEPATVWLASTGALCAGGWWMLKRRRRAQT